MISFVNETSSGFLNSTTNNLSYTVATGDDRLLIVYIYSSADTVTNVEYDGVGATFINKQVAAGAAAGQYINMWYLLAPNEGTANITVTSSGNLGGFVTGCDYTGILQMSQPDVEDTTLNASTNTLTTTLTTTVDNDWIMGYAYHNGTVSAGANTTLRGGPNAVLQAFDTNAAQTPAGNHSVTTDSTTTDFALHVTAAFKPVPSPNNGNFFAVM